jgi:hypothetical protein
MSPLRPRRKPRPLLKDPAVIKNYPKFYKDILLPASPPARRDSAFESGRITPELKRLEAVPSRLSPQA